jgi:hypothetical protein
MRLSVVDRLENRDRVRRSYSGAMARARQREVDRSATESSLQTSALLKAVPAFANNLWPDGVDCILNDSAVDIWTKEKRVISWNCGSKR